MKNKRPRVIIFEGLKGVGKTTLAKNLVKYLQDNSYNAIYLKPAFECSDPDSAGMIKNTYMYLCQHLYATLGWELFLKLRDELRSGVPSSFTLPMEPFDVERWREDSIHILLCYFLFSKVVANITRPDSVFVTDFIVCDGSYLGIQALQRSRDQTLLLVLERLKNLFERELNACLEEQHKCYIKHASPIFYLSDKSRELDVEEKEFSEELVDLLEEQYEDKVLFMPQSKPGRMVYAGDDMSTLDYILTKTRLRVFLNPNHPHS